MKNNSRIIATIVLGVLASSQAFAFCGFYVAKADAKLFNKTSEVIMVRNGEKSTITMSSDFQGDVKDFAIVVPVPVVLQKEQVKVVDPGLFRKIDDYSGPRLVSYYDEDPCAPPMANLYPMGMAEKEKSLAKTSMVNKSVNNEAVKIEAQYQVGEYDILILSATESGALEKWLLDNGYKIPEGAKEVLDPYIKSNLKFFVVKANTEELKRMGTEKLRPIQISYNSPKFMLPIRLGMANAKDAQDMVVYAFSNKGRVEVTNYRTVEMPTGQDVPQFVEEKFGEFYKDLYYKSWAKEGKNSIMLEYGWDISGQVTTSCDPCVGPPPMLADLLTCGIDWVKQYHGGYQGNVYFTRLHTTYDRAHFPQDLQFIETPNKQNYQARYVLHIPASSTFECEKANSYLVGLQKRREGELDNLASLTGWDIAKYSSYATEYNQYIKKESDQPAPGDKKKDKKKQGSLLGNGNIDRSDMMLGILSALTLTLIVFALTRKNKKPVLIPVKKNDDLK